MSDQERYLTAPEAAEYLHVTIGTLRFWRERQNLPFHRQGSAYLYLPSELDAWMSQRPKGPFLSATKAARYIHTSPDKFHTLVVEGKFTPYRITGLPVFLQSELDDYLAACSPPEEVSYEPAEKLSKTRAIRYLGTSHEVLERLMSQGDLPYHQGVIRVYFLKSELDDWMLKKMAELPDQKKVSVYHFVSIQEKPSTKGSSEPGEITAAEAARYTHHSYYKFQRLAQSSDLPSIVRNGITYYRLSDLDAWMESRKDYLSAQQACDLLGVKLHALNAACDRGGLPFHMVDGHRCFLRTEVETWQEARLSDPTYTLRGAADYLHLNSATLLTYANRGQIPYTRHGQAYSFKQSDLDAWLESSQTNPLLSAKRAAEHLNIPISRFNRLVAQGLIPPQDGGKFPVFYQSDLDAWRMEQPKETLLTLTAAQDYLHISREKLKALVAQGDIPSYGPPRYPRFDPSDLDAWLAANGGEKYQEPSLSAPRAAEYLGIPLRRIKMLADRGIIPCYEDGWYRFFAISDLDAWKEEHQNVQALTAARARAYLHISAAKFNELVEQGIIPSHDDGYHYLVYYLSELDAWVEKTK